VIQLNDRYFEVFIKEAELQEEVSSLANKINSDYHGKDVLFLAVLNGSSDLVKQINGNCEISFVKVSSYSGTISSGRVDELIGLTSSVENRHVIVLEDIVDSGLTIDKIVSLLKADNPLSVKVCTLLFKPEAFKGKQHPEYIGFSIPNSFVVGYGLDYDEKGRNLKEIYQLKEV
jgi:hypoxanthine phosphoribosyltransferase